MKNEILIDEDLMRIEYFYDDKKINQNIAFVFTPFMNRNLEGNSYGGDLLLNNGFDVIAFKVSNDNWFQSIPLLLFDLISQIILKKKYIKKIAYGSSMGGYAAIALSNLLDASTVIAFSPQYRIDEDFDKRWASRAREINFNYRITDETINKDCIFFVIYDNKDLDQLHVERISKIIPRNNLNLIKIPFAGHPVTNYLYEVGLIKKVVIQLSQKNSINQINFIQSKKKSKYYLLNISRMLFERNHFKWSLNIIVSTIQLTDDNMILNDIQNTLMAGDVDYIINKKVEYFNLALHHKNIGATDIARGILENYIKIIGLDISAGMNLADIYNQSSEFLRAEELFSQINEQWPNYASAYCCLSLSLVKRNKIAEALNVLNKAVKYINYFEEHELKNFCIHYATVALKSPVDLRDYSIFDRLKIYSDDYNALALYSLKYTYYPKVKDDSKIEEIIVKKLSIGKKKFLITRPGNIEVIAALNNQFTPTLKNNAGISEPNIANRKTSFDIWLQQYNSAMKMSDGVMLVRTPSDLCSSYVNLIGIPEEKCLTYLGQLDVWLGLLEKLLKNYKILFISSFSESIKINKYGLNKIHNFKYNFNIDNIIEIQAPFTLAGEPQKSWISEKDSLLLKINKIDYDIAFVSCGGYGHSVCLEIFNMDKSAIYVGGLLQTFFGIIGNRWNSDHVFVRTFMNPFWTKPLASEIPLNSHLVENSCYW
jgi:hypothetical protein